MKKVKVSLLKKNVPNQFVIETEDGRYFQSKDALIVFIDKTGKVFIDEYYWNYHRTISISKYRNIFLGETTKETEAKMRSGEYEVVNLNE